MMSNFQNIKAHLKNHTIGIAGCGGLGSNCAVSLARSGIGQLVIVDFDKVESSNLNRQFYFKDQIGEKKVDALQENIRRINPEVVVQTYNEKLNEHNILKIFENCEIIVEAFDLAEMKHLIIESILQHYPEKYIVSGVGLAGWGKSNDLRVRSAGKLIICGDETLEVTEALPPLAPRVNIVANMQANEVLNLLLKDLS